LGHWRAANENDDEHRIHAELMAKKDFDYPYSTPGLLACKAAELQGGKFDARKNVQPHSKGPHDRLRQYSRF